MTLNLTDDPSELAPAEPPVPAPAAEDTPPTDGPVMERLHAQLAAAREVRAAGESVSAAAFNKGRADARMYRAALHAAEAGLTWPEIREALGPADDKTLPTTEQLYARARRTIEPTG